MEWLVVLLYVLHAGACLYFFLAEDCFFQKKKKTSNFVIFLFRGLEVDKGYKQL